MLRALIAFEWRHQSRQPAFFAAAAFFALMGCVVQANGLGQANVRLDSPFVVMFATGFLSLLSVFAMAVFAANAVLRDAEHRMDGIIFTTAVEKRDYLAGRFAGACLAGITVLAIGSAAMAITTFTPLVDADRVAAFSPWPYVAALAVLAVPNVVLVAVLLFAIAAVTRSALATYAGAVVLYLLYFAVAALTNSPLMAASSPGAGGGSLLALLDPFGLSAFFEATRLWTASAKNVRPVAFEPLLLANRALCLAAALLLAAVAYRLFSFRTNRERPPAADADDGAREPRFGSLPSISSAFASMLALQLRILTTKPFIGLLGVWIALAASEIYSRVLDAEYRATLIPSSGVIASALHDPLQIVGSILAIFFGAELYWRERRYRFTPILDATPVPSITIVGAKAVTLAAMIALLVVAGTLPGLVLQLVRAPEHLTFAAYGALFVSPGVSLLAFAVAVLLIHAVVRNKYAGMVVSLLFLIVTKQPSMLGLTHPLWQFGTTPPLRHSEVSGFGYDVAPALLMAAHWLVFATLLFLTASALWRTRREVPRIAIAIAVVASVATGSWLYAKIDAGDVDDWREAYERTYRDRSTTPRPRVAAIDAAIDVFDRRVNVTSRYELVNDTNAPMSRVLVAVRREARNVLVEIDGARVAHDARFGMYDFALARPLQPGARTELRYSASLTRELFDLQGGSALAPSGTFLLNFQLLPTIGYRDTYEIDAPRERRKRGLTPRETSIEADVPAHTEDVRFAATISTPIAQTPVAPGAIERTWTDAGRRYVRFAQPRMRNFFGIASAEYETTTRTHDATPIELLHVRGHEANAQRILDVAAASLDLFEEIFGPYRGGRLRLAEVPSWANFGALATPSTIFLTEHRTFLIDRRDPNRPDLLARRIAHEVAHQWWGYEVAPASDPGATFVVESLAKYGELLLVDRLLDEEQLRAMLEIERDRYLAGRAADPNGEVPLLRVGNQPHLYYGKGAIVMWAIRDLLGEERLHAALRAFVAEQSTRHGLTRAGDLLPHLRRVASGDEYALIEQWLGDIVLYDLAIRSARFANGVLTLQTNVTKVRATADGSESALPFDEPVTIRVSDAEGKLLHTSRHSLRANDELMLNIDGSPSHVEIDPGMTRIDTNLRNNEVAIVPAT